MDGGLDPRDGRGVAAAKAEETQGDEGQALTTKSPSFVDCPKMPLVQSSLPVNGFLNYSPLRLSSIG
jgi:hypothetical protein